MPNLDSNVFELNIFHPFSSTTWRDVNTSLSQVLPSSVAEVSARRYHCYRSHLLFASSWFFIVANPFIHPVYHCYHCYRSHLQFLLLDCHPVVAIFAIIATSHIYFLIFIFVYHSIIAITSIFASSWLSIVAKFYYTFNDFHFSSYKITIDIEQYRFRHSSNFGLLRLHDWTQ